MPQEKLAVTGRMKQRHFKLISLQVGALTWVNKINQIHIFQEQLILQVSVGVLVALAGKSLRVYQTSSGSFQDVKR